MATDPTWPPPLEGPTGPGPNRAEAEMRLRPLLRDTLRRPRSAMARLAERPGRRWVAPLLVLAVLVVVSGLAAFPASRRHTEAVARVRGERVAEANPELAGVRTPEEAAALDAGSRIATTAGAVGVVLAGLFVFLGAAVTAAVLHFLGTILGGQQTYTQMLTVVAWARWPLVIREILRIPAYLLGGWDPNPAGLSGLVAADPLAVDALPGFWQPVLGQVEVWTLWTLALTVIGVAAAARLSTRKAVVAVGAYLLLVLALGELGVALGRFGASMF